MVRINYRQEGPLIVKYQFIELHGTGAEVFGDLQTEVLHVLRLLLVELEHIRLLYAFARHVSIIASVHVKVGEQRPLVAGILLAIHLPCFRRAIPVCTGIPAREEVVGLWRDGSAGLELNEPLAVDALASEPRWGQDIL